ncbi:hypothetical protein FCG40_01700 [Fimbriimonadia bacterium ATM]|nr:MAG: hypothetical protein EDM73_09785 [Armatimonadota bacterium]MBC6970663.1 hypothetical protein [Armatimonadota bacterium]MCE7899608.1 hypothetical protein [Armatimonadetes bacterium ATM1]MDL1927693.1 hypothetical protein [Fimbriimonadia bacterium ATM]RIJ96379.1 MAG: hypothetical protein DCC45_06880 [Armatimonadota bacterium]
MRFVVGVSCVALAVGGVVGLPVEEKVAFTFRGVGYVHRYSKDDLHEYTPKGKPSLEKWADMVTVNVYRNVKDGEGLAATANGVLETYKANQAMVVRTDSVPRTEKREAEHLIVVLFPRKEFIEAAFARFRIEGGARRVHRVFAPRVWDEGGECDERVARQERAWNREGVDGDEVGSDSSEVMGSARGPL